MTTQSIEQFAYVLSVLGVLLIGAAILSAWLICRSKTWR